MIFKRFLLVVFTLFLSFTALAVEGMWVPVLIERNIEQMRQMGLNLSVEDLYSDTNPSLNDAIVRFGRGCTGAFISPEGLLITNHHCGLGQIQRHSSVENDFITHGFYAQSRDEELPNPGLTVSIQVRMQDVTDQIVPQLSQGMTEAERSAEIDRISKKIAEGATENGKYQAIVAPLFHGNQFFLFVSKVFSDVRLVMAPPLSIGKFGGDEDNWMWPRHSGDFAIFRVYADSLNLPAEYHPDNQPYRPRHFFPISAKPINEGDFTMVYGFPGRTAQYLFSDAVDYIVNKQNPTAIDLRGRALDIIYHDMGQSDQVRIQYTSKAAGISNAWKRWQGENRGLIRLDAINVKRQGENEFEAWANKNEKGLPFRNLFGAFRETYRQINPLRFATTLLNEAGRRVEVVRFAQNFFRLAEMSRVAEISDAEIARQVQTIKTQAGSFFRDYNPPTDQRILTEMLEAYMEMAQPPFVPPILTEIQRRHRGGFGEFARRAFSRSILVCEKKTMEFLEGYRRPHHRKLERDLVFQLALSLDNFHSKMVRPHQTLLETSLDSLYRVYLAGMKKMNPETNFFPDANGTLRITFGQIESSFPRDAVKFIYYSTTNGILEKAQLTHIRDYAITPEFRSLLAQKDFEPYGREGKLVVNFIASNHTTGGNSGSPVLDGHGNFIGINFDRSWESTMSDIMFDPNQSRNISVSSNYILWVLDRVAGMGHLLEEMTIVKE